MTTSTKTDFTKKQLQALADFWPVFANPQFVYETEDEPETSEEGVFVLPGRTLSAEAEAFEGMVYTQGWVLNGFDWPEWSQTDEFKDLFSDPQAVAKATALQLAQLLTALIRKDRFCSGTMACACQDGLLSAITHRASKLV